VPTGVFVSMASMRIRATAQEQDTMARSAPKPLTIASVLPASIQAPAPAESTPTLAYVCRVTPGRLALQVLFLSLS